MFLMGQSRFRQGKIAERTTGKATNLIRAKSVKANEDFYTEMAQAA